MPIEPQFTYTAPANPNYIYGSEGMIRISTGEGIKIG